MYKSSRHNFVYNNINNNDNNVVITILRHIESPGIVQTVYLCIFRHIE